MIFWIPSTAIQPLHLWANHKSYTPLHCQMSDWNGTFYPDFELLLEEQLGITCLSIEIDSSSIEQCINTIYRHVLRDKETTLMYIHTQKDSRRELFLSQLKSHGKIDIGLYDCGNLLSLLDEEVLLCFRLNGSVPDYLTFWLDYTAMRAKIKPLFLTNETTRFLGRLKGVEKLTLPDLNSGEILSASLSALKSLTGQTIDRVDIEELLSMSDSLEEFLSLIQLRAVRGTLLVE
ncbi:hypothetical protein OAA_18465 [Vibrio cyclitrophicus 1F175]|uniref:hypothetical protein n=1 Tax=Vibrio cyclitrophicus TaxID=47951 RepID=UPI0002F27915|nr:hypothetical protein [Vibrio cyclitrophicus]OEF62547.1 hypothetical protein OAA_18465 [Vibrio cyclitrophicus 1F175]PMH86082.1 hypothetical protein BCU60_10435 [Vibrio cyclitrophicus]